MQRVHSMLAIAGCILLTGCVTRTVYVDRVVYAGSPPPTVQTYGSYESRYHIAPPPQPVVHYYAPPPVPVYYGSYGYTTGTYIGFGARATPHVAVAPGYSHRRRAPAPIWVGHGTGSHHGHHSHGRHR